MTPFVLPEHPPEFWDRLLHDLVTMVEVNDMQNPSNDVLKRMVAGTTEVAVYFAQEARRFREAHAKALAERDQLVNRCNYLEDLCGDRLGVVNTQTLEAVSERQPSGPFLVVDVQKSNERGTLIFWEEGSDYYTQDVAHAKKYKSVYAAQMATIEDDCAVIAESKAKAWGQLPKTLQEQALEDPRHSIWS